MLLRHQSCRHQICSSERPHRDSETNWDGSRGTAGRLRGGRVGIDGATATRGHSAGGGGARDADRPPTARSRFCIQSGSVTSCSADSSPCVYLRHALRHRTHVGSVFPASREQ